VANEERETPEAPPERVVERLVPRRIDIAVPPPAAAAGGDAGAAPRASASTPAGPPGVVGDVASALAHRATFARAAASRGPARRREPPPVRVTIGRVEVRAVAAPAPPARTPRADPALRPLSLDEYLDQRRSGRR
jgi:hypothetical protein